MIKLIVIEPGFGLTNALGCYSRDAEGFGVGIPGEEGCQLLLKSPSLEKANEALEIIRALGVEDAYANQEIDWQGIRELAVAAKNWLHKKPGCMAALKSAIRDLG